MSRRLRLVWDVEKQDFVDPRKLERPARTPRERPLWDREEAAKRHAIKILQPNADNWKLPLPRDET